MDEKKLKTVIEDAKSMGGVVLRHQKLRLHANGAKFTINKTYIDDEVLSPKSYTMILIPEPLQETPADDFFEGIIFQDVEFTFNDATMFMTLPYFVLDSDHFSAEFTVSLSRIKTLPLPKHIKPKEVAPGKGAVFIGGQYYKKLNMDPENKLETKPISIPYIQVVIMLVITYLGEDGSKSMNGYYPLSILVDNYANLIGGIGLNGFPMIFADSIKFNDKGDHRDCIVQKEGKHVLTLSMDKIPQSEVTYQNITYCKREGHLIRFTVTEKGLRGESNSPDVAKLTLGDSEVVKQLKDLDIDLKPKNSLYSTGLKGIIGPREILEKLD